MFWKKIKKLILVAFLQCWIIWFVKFLLIVETNRLPLEKSWHYAYQDWQSCHISVIILSFFLFVFGVDTLVNFGYFFDHLLFIYKSK